MFKTKKPLNMKYTEKKTNSNTSKKRQNDTPQNVRNIVHFANISVQAKDEALVLLLKDAPSKVL